MRPAQVLVTFSYYPLKLVQIDDLRLYFVMPQRAACRESMCTGNEAVLKSVLIVDRDRTAIDYDGIEQSDFAN